MTSCARLVCDKVNKVATAIKGGQAPCRRMHPRGPLPQSGRFSAFEPVSFPVGLDTLLVNWGRYPSICTNLFPVLALSPFSVPCGFPEHRSVARLRLFAPPLSSCPRRTVRPTPFWGRSGSTLRVSLPAIRPTACSRFVHEADSGQADHPSEQSDPGT